MKYGSDTPTAIPAKIKRNPMPYPKAIPATHIEGEVGRSKVGNIAAETNIRTARTGLLNVSVSQFMIGITSCKYQCNN